MVPLRGLCSKSSEQHPPVASMAWRCRCGSTSIGREAPARSEVSDGATVSVPPEPPADSADPGRVSRVGREFCDIEVAGGSESRDRPGLYAIDRCPPTGWMRAARG